MENFICKSRENPPQIKSLQNILDLKYEIQNYPQINKLHKGDDIERLGYQFDSIVYRINNDVLKFESSYYLKENNYAFYREIIVGL